MLRRAALGLFLLLCVDAHAQTIYPPINAPVFRALDANGHPLAGGKLFTYAAGSSTPLATYADATTGTPNPNPVILDANGQAKIFLGLSVYKFVLQDANGVQQWTVDSISGKPKPSDVTSVFGRNGDVVAVTGDYTCSQVTGAVCSQPTLYYQTVQQAGTGQTQRGRLNLLSGTGATVTCADNSAADSTDCTFAAAASTTAVTATSTSGTITGAASGCDASAFQVAGFWFQVAGIYYQSMTGKQQSDCGGGNGNGAEQMTLPQACPTAIISTHVTSLEPSQTMGDDTHGSDQVLVSTTLSTVTTQRKRLADHGSDPSKPVVSVICY